MFRGHELKFNPSPTYLGITLDRTLSFRNHLTKCAQKVQTRNNIIRKLAGTSWGADADVMRTSSLALVYSAAEYGAPVWLNSHHTKILDTKLNCTLRMVTGTIRSTPTSWLPALSGIAPAHLRRRRASETLNNALQSQADLPIHKYEAELGRRLKSRNPPFCPSLVDGSEFNLNEAWNTEWAQTPVNKELFVFSPATKPAGFSLPRKVWCRLNRVRTGHGRCAHLKHKWGWIDSPACECGAPNQTIDHIFRECSIYKYMSDFNDLLILNNDMVDWLSSLSIEI